MTTLPRKVLLNCGAAAGVLAFATGAWAQQRAFDIPAQPATQAVPEFARQAGLQIITSGSELRGVQSQPVKGEHDVRAALALMLTGTGLAVESDDGSTIVLRKAAANPQSGSAAGDGAEGTVEALIVTAQKREEDIQDVPIAISAFTQEQLERSQVAGGPDLMTQVPNFTFTKTNFSGYSIQIRGIGTQAISATTDPAVAVAFNNTPFIRNRFFEQEFYDLQRVEVLRGPQGTLYGRNATAGVVNIISAKPAHRFEAKLSGDVSNYSSSRLEGMVNIPLVEDTVALRVAGAWTKRDGYVKNTLTGDQTDGRNLWSTRVTLGLDPVDWLNVNLIWEHFEENDDRLRTGKQLCNSDPGPSEVAGIPVEQTGAPIQQELTAVYVSQGCRPGSLYSPDSFDTPNGFALPYYAPFGLIGLPVFMNLNPYVNTFQSQNVREIETHLTPEYTAESDLIELQLQFDLPGDLTLASETGYLRDFIFSFSDFNRFNTRPGVFTPGGATHIFNPEDLEGPGNRPDITDLNGTFCDPQLGCTNRLAAGDLSTAKSQQFAQEFRLSSNFDGPFNFNLGVNFLRYDTEEKYYVFINTVTMWAAGTGRSPAVYPDGPPWEAGVSDNGHCLGDNFYGNVVADPTRPWSMFGCIYIDPNDIHNLNDQGRNYFLSKNPYHLLSYAGFGEAYYNIAENLKVTAGFRWTVDKKTAPVIPSWLLAGPPVGQINNREAASWGLPVHKVIELEWREPTGRLAVDWKPELSFTDETLVYGSYVRGYKAGGANPPPPVLVLATVCPPECGDLDDDASPVNRLVDYYLTHPETFEAEYVDAYELGTKNTFLDGAVTANLAAFYYDYKNYQISQIVDRSAINFNYDAEVWGAEVELDWRPLENLRLGFKGGYERTKVANGEQAIDLMDRTAGEEGWIVLRPFPTLPSNCVVPEWLATAHLGQETCAAYLIGVDPITYLPYVANPTVTDFQLPEGYPGYDPRSANNGQGFLKDLSGNELPNAPDFTLTVTADYTVPLPNEWLMTLHTDLYYQSEAWTRIFNTEGYDKLKAYTNMNLAAIFTNEDAGWTVMAYVKNVFDKDNITGAFLNSDDTGLTTNIFLNEPRLYGLRVTKEWTGGSSIPWLTAKREGPFPLTVELGGQVQRVDAQGEVLISFADAFTGAFDPSRPQTEDLDWTHGPELRLTYRPSGSPWKIAGGVRYGRTSNDTGRLGQSESAGDAVCRSPRSGKYAPYFPGVDFGFIGKLLCDPEYGPVTKTFDTPYGPFTFTFENKYDPDNLLGPTNRLSSATRRVEDHLLIDFAVGKDVGLGFLGDAKSSLSAGLRYAEFESTVSGDMRGIPDMTFPEDGWATYNTTFHQYAATFDGHREFKGVGPTLSWEASTPLWGNDESGHLNLDWTLTGGALFGKQKTTINGAEGSTYFNARYPRHDWVVTDLGAPTQTPLDITPRSKSVTVPVFDLSLGLSYEVPGIKLSTGYRWERYFDVIDAGFMEHKSYDRTLDGPYFKLAVGFGGG
jgi:iron complex outermembrane receptor protein